MPTFEKLTVGLISMVLGVVALAIVLNTISFVAILVILLQLVLGYAVSEMVKGFQKG